MPLPPRSGVKRRWIDAHAHVVPVHVIDSVRRNPKLYGFEIEGSDGHFTFTFGPRRIAQPTFPELVDDTSFVERQRSRIDRGLSGEIVSIWTELGTYELPRNWSLGARCPGADAHTGEGDQAGSRQSMKVSSHGDSWAIVESNIPARPGHGPRDGAGRRANLPGAAARTVRRPHHPRLTVPSFDHVTGTNAAVDAPQEGR